MLIKIKCPQCKQNLKGVYPYTTATFSYDRKCPKCKTKWRLTVTPLKKTKNYCMHDLEWVAK